MSPLPHQTERKRELFPFSQYAPLSSFWSFPTRNVFPPAEETALQSPSLWKTLRHSLAIAPPPSSTSWITQLSRRNRLGAPSPRLPRARNLHPPGPLYLSTPSLKFFPTPHENQSKRVPPFPHHPFHILPFPLSYPPFFRGFLLRMCPLDSPVVTSGLGCYLLYSLDFSVWRHSRLFNFL